MVCSMSKAVQVGAKGPGQVGGGVPGAGPPQPHDGGPLTAPGGQPLDGDADEGALHDGGLAVGVAHAGAFGVQVVPGADVDVAVGVGVVGVGVVGGGPAGGVRAVEAGAVAWGAAGAAAGRGLRRGGGKDPGRSGAPGELGGAAGQL